MRVFVSVDFVGFNLTGGFFTLKVDNGGECRRGYFCFPDVSKIRSDGVYLQLSLLGSGQLLTSGEVLSE